MPDGAPASSLVHQLHEGNVLVRKHALLELGRMGRAAIPLCDVISTVMQDGDWQVGRLAHIVLGRIWANALRAEGMGAFRHLHRIIALLEEPDPSFKRSVLVMLSNNCQSIATTLRRSDSKQRTVARGILLSVTSGVAGHAPFFLELLRDVDRHVRWAALSMLGGLNRRTAKYTECISTRLADSEVRVRRLAAKLLGKAGIEAAPHVEAIGALLGDDATRRTALLSLARIRISLSSSLEGPAPETVDMERAKVCIDKVNKLVRRRASEFASFLSDAKDEIRRVALVMLPDLDGSVVHLPAMIALAGEDGEALRLAAVFALCRMCERADAPVAARRALRDMASMAVERLGDPSSVVREMAFLLLHDVARVCKRGRNGDAAPLLLQHAERIVEATRHPGTPPASRLCGMRALYLTGPGATAPFVSTFVAMLQGDDVSVKRTALHIVRTLAIFDGVSVERHVGAVVATLGDADARIKVVALQILCGEIDRRVVEPHVAALAPLLHDEAPRVREGALCALRYVGPPAASPYLQGVAAQLGHRDSRVRREALRTMRVVSSAARSHARAVIALLLDSTSAVRCEAVRCIRTLDLASEMDDRDYATLRAMHLHEHRYTPREVCLDVAELLTSWERQWPAERQLELALELRRRQLEQIRRGAMPAALECVRKVAQVGSLNARLVGLALARCLNAEHLRDFAWSLKTGGASIGAVFPHVAEARWRLQRLPPARDDCVWVEAQVRVDDMERACAAWRSRVHVWAITWRVSLARIPCDVIRATSEALGGLVSRAWASS